MHLKQSFKSIAFGYMLYKEVNAKLGFASQNLGNNWCAYLFSRNHACAKRMIVTPEGLLHLPAGASVTMGSLR